MASAKGRGAGPNLDEPGAEAQGDRDGQRHRRPQRRRARRRHQAGACATTASTATTTATTTTTTARPRPRRRRRPRVPNPIPDVAGVASRQIKHVIFINKENATHDLLLGDITATRSGVPVNGEPAFSLGADRQPESPRAGAALRVQRQLLPRAGRVLGRPPLADRTRTRPSSRRRTGRPRTAAGATIRATTPRSSRTIRAASASPTRTPRPSRTTTTSTAASTRTWCATARASSTSATASSSPLIDEDGGDRADRRPRARQRADGEGRPRQQRSPVPDVQHAHPRRAAAGGPRSLQPVRALQAGVRVPLRRPRARRLQAAAATSTSTTRTTTAAAPTTSTPTGPTWDVHALRAGQRRGARPDRRADLEQPVLEGHRHLRRRGRHAERPGPRRRLPVDLPGDQPVGEARERQQDPHSLASASSRRWI